jgi:hypothetical protein
VVPPSTQARSSISRIDQRRQGNSLRTNFVLVDFENVQPDNMRLLNGGPFKIKIFLGAKQGKIPLEIARALQVFGPDAEYIQIDGNGSNALDFHIAYHIGRLSKESPDAFFHVISKDTGFDPLINHLRAQKIFCQRSGSVGDIPLLKGPPASPEKFAAVIACLVKNKTNKPRTLKTLANWIKAHFTNELDDEELDQLIAHLVTQGVIRLADGIVRYELPS